MTIETLDLAGYSRILYRRRWIVYATVATICLVTLIASFLATPLYQATTRLEISRHGPDILDMRDVSRADLGWSAADQFYHTQYTIIGSMPVARLAAERLELTSHPDFAESAKEPGLWSRVLAMIPRRNGKQVERAPIEIAAATLLGGLEVVPKTGSYLVDVSWVHEDPEFAADVANAIAEAYIQFTLTSRYTTTDQAREFLVDQIGTLKREISAIEERLQEYGESKKIFSVDDATSLTLRALHDISERRTEVQTALATAEAIYRTVLDAPPDALPEVLNSSLIQRLSAEYAGYEADYSEKAKSFKPDWPALQSLKSKMEQARTRLDLETEGIVGRVRAAAESDYHGALEEVRNLDRLLAEHEGAAQQQRRDGVEYTNLQSEVRKKRETLDALLRRQDEMTLSARLKHLDDTSSNVQVIERAQPPVASFYPKTGRNLLMALALSLTLGAALAFLLDYLDNTIVSGEELEQLLSLPVLAIIPQHGETDSALARVRRRPAPAGVESIDLICHADRQSIISEAYRTLRTSILLSNPGRPPRRIVVTSALPEEGKTSLVLNLGIVLAQLGRKVLLVDTDLRRPRLHRALGLSNRQGVSRYLSGLEPSVGALIVPTGIDQLDLIPSGPVPPNPSELLNSTTFSELGDALIEKGYDHVIFDSPPALSVTDASIIASVADSGILVLRAGRTTRQSVQLAAERLSKSRGGPFGVVLNGLDGDRHRYYCPEYGQHPLDPAPPEAAEAPVETARRSRGA